jgi:hypothetical protein
VENQEKIVAYNSKGIPLTGSQYKKEIDEIIRKIENGMFVTQKEMEKKSEPLHPSYTSPF